MPKPVRKKLQSWSYSRYNEYVTCPARAYYKFIIKLPEPKNQAMDRGISIHDKAHEYIIGKAKKFPRELETFRDELKWRKKLFKTPGKVIDVEETWAFKKDWSPTTWNDWNECWLRIKVDCAHYDYNDDALIIDDWKTGRYRQEFNDKYMEQLELYALGGFLQMPQVQTIIPQLDYVDIGLIFPIEEELVYDRSQMTALKNKWKKKTNKMMNDTTFKPTPGAHCRYCHFRKSNNGPCEY